MTTLMALLLDLANILGGLILAAGLLREVPRAGAAAGRGLDVLGRFGFAVGVLALVAAGYWLVVHLTSGPHVFHFELIGLGVGVALLWERLARRDPADRRAAGDPSAAGASGSGAPGHVEFRDRAPRPAPTGTLTGLSGPGLLLAVFGVIAVLVGIQGLFTPDS